MTRALSSRPAHTVSVEIPGKSAEGAEALSTPKWEVTPTDIFHFTPGRTNVIHRYLSHCRRSCPWTLGRDGERSEGGAEQAGDRPPVTNGCCPAGGPRAFPAPERSIAEVPPNKDET